MAQEQKNTASCKEESTVSRKKELSLLIQQLKAKNEVKSSILMAGTSSLQNQEAEWNKFCQQYASIDDLLKIIITQEDIKNWYGRDEFGKLITDCLGYFERKDINGRTKTSQIGNIVGVAPSPQYKLGDLYFVKLYAKVQFADGKLPESVPFTRLVPFSMKNVDKLIIWRRTCCKNKLRIQTTESVNKKLKQLKTENGRVLSTYEETLLANGKKTLDPTDEDLSRSKMAFDAIRIRHAETTGNTNALVALEKPFKKCQLMKNEKEEARTSNFNNLLGKYSKSKYSRSNQVGDIVQSNNISSDNDEIFKRKHPHRNT